MDVSSTDLYYTIRETSGDEAGMVDKAGEAAEARRASAARGPGASRDVRYWIVCAPRPHPPEPEEVLCVTGSPGDATEEAEPGRDTGDAGNGGGPSRALAVFSFREEAEAFSALRAGGEGCQVRELGGRELISLLYGLWGGFLRVALDPIPENECRGADGLVIVSREEFVKLLVSRLRYPSPQPLWN